jgi:hypothetical protein
MGTSGDITRVDREPMKLEAGMIGRWRLLLVAAAIAGCAV